MNRKEKLILKELIKRKDGLVSPADFINGIAQQDRRAVENLVAMGYVEEVPQDRIGHRGTYSLNFYRATEKALVEFSYYKKFLFNLKTQTGLLIGIFSILTSIFIALYVPYYQKNIQQKAAVQSLYKEILTNQDIFISNSNNKRKLIQNDSVENLPELFIASNIDDETRKILQEKFGLIQYRWLLYYLQQTKLLNDEIDMMNSYLIIQDKNGTMSSGYLNSKNSYINTTNSLEKGDGVKFNYVEDTECLYYFFEQTFRYLNIDHRGRATCEDESVFRLVYNFGYIEVDTPSWLLSQIKKIINTKKLEMEDVVTP